MTSTAMKSRTRASVSSTPAGDLLILAGEIDDTTSLAAFGEELRVTPTVDLGSVNFINSVGVREWITFLDQLEQRGLKVTLRNVSEPMVRQMTMVMEARGQAVIESFYAPYTCPKCGDERALLIKVDEHRGALDAQVAPELPCPACGADSEFDEFPARYLSFLIEEPT